MRPQPDDTATPAIRTRMKGALVKVLKKARPQGRGRFRASAGRAGGYVTLAQTGLRKMFRSDAWFVDPRLDVAQPAPGMDRATDPVRLMASAIDLLGPASYRAAVHGRPLTVTVADEPTAAVFRAALELTAAERPTDRLIRVAVQSARPASPLSEVAANDA